MDRIGFVGAGNMGYPLLLGAKKVFGAERIRFTAKTQEERSNVQRKSEVYSVDTNIMLAEECKYIVLAVKPQFMEAVLLELKDYICKEHVIISIAAGVTIDNIKNGLMNHARVIRTMPNLPALVGEGMTCLCYDEAIFTEEEINVVLELFSSVGSIERLPENLINAAVCANGSSPAYVFMFIEALTDSVVKYGIPRDKAYRLVAQTVLGSAKMILESKEHPGELKDRVCSPGGTTIAGVAALEEYGFRNAVIKATDSCYKKTEELSFQR